jgi:hypothetical protein
MSWNSGGLLWLFGGTSDSAFMGDLWTFDYTKARNDGKPSAASWVFQGGDRNGNSNGNASSWPASRQYATSWTDSAGDLWLWSGFGSRTHNDTDGGYLNDLWRYDVRQKHWVREQAAAAASSTAATASPLGKTWANSWSTKQGDLFVFSGFGADTKIHNDMWRFTSHTRTWELLYNYSHYHAVKVHNKTKQVGVGLGGVYNCTSAGGAPPAPGACLLHPGARENAYTMTDATTGKLWLFGGSGYAFDNSSKGGMNDFWSFDAKTMRWKFEGGFADSWSKPLPNATDQAFAGWGGGRHGTLGVGSTRNLPGADHAGYFWNDPLGGKLWLMGGENGAKRACLEPFLHQNDRFTETGLGRRSENLKKRAFCAGNTDKTGHGVFSDLWSLEPSNLSWTWESGPGMNVFGSYLVSETIDNSV